MSRGRCCPNCRQQHRPGEFFCEVCGTDLTGAASAPNSLVSRQLQDYATLYDPFEPETQPVDKFTQNSRQQGTVAFDDQAFLQIEFNGFHDPLVLSIPPHRPLVFGRGNPSLGQIDIDLTPYNGHSQGISRHHAAIVRQGKRLLLWDLGSTNGSY
ncbi:MAG: FHA domain-containing protein, partial [Anaerolineae bacterium]|nr:FHA domain-containing protein [Anaerolineae bacterium]